jgi:prolyl-tRNA editing enzyme YbaK/EbsC (Cys-tRNA(Pro) deacylase)
MTYHRITQEIQDLLTENQCWFETFEHEPVRTSEEAVRTRPGYSLRQGAKTIVVRVRTPRNEKRFVMLVFPADLKFNNSKVKALLDAKDIRFATPEEVTMLTDGIESGGVPPFGNLFGLEVVADCGLFENERIVFNAGDRRFSVAMKSADYRELVDPTVADIAQKDT